MNGVKFDYISVAESATKKAFWRCWMGSLSGTSDSCAHRFKWIAFLRTFYFRYIRHAYYELFVYSYYR